MHSYETDYLYYGELYQPELSNLRIYSLGTNFEAVDDLDIALLMHHYQPEELDIEKPGVTIDLDSDGLSRGPGSAIGLIASYEASDELEQKFIAMVFKSGNAYGTNRVLKIDTGR